MPFPVVGAMSTCQCTFGALPCALTVTSQQKWTCNGVLVATIMDKVFVMPTATFGICTSLTKLAGGVPTPCAPAFPLPWAPGAGPKNTIMGLPVLTENSVLQCIAPIAAGGPGTISIAPMGNTIPPLPVPKLTT
ncbi:MAG: PAAR-like protein [Gemmataceae bacterium]